MAKVSLSILVSDVRNRLGNVVFSKWKDTNYVREYVKYSKEPSARQAEVRNAFSLLVSLWKASGSLLKASWNNHAKGLNMTGRNAFIGANLANALLGRALELFKELGEYPLASLSAEQSKNPGEITCVFEYSSDASQKHVVFFAQKIAGSRLAEEIIIQDAGVFPASPYAITGLEPGAEYAVYAVVADNTCADAKAVSSALAATAAAGA